MRSSSSMPPTIRHFCSSSLCSPQIYIAIIILLYIYLTLENSISLHQKILNRQKDSVSSSSSSSTSTSLSMDLARQSLIQHDTYITTPPPPPPPPTPFPPPSPSPPPPPPPSPPPPSIESQILPFTGNFYEDFNIHWGDGRGKVVNNGTGLTLSLDRYSGSGFESRKQYLFAKISMQIKLVPNNSAGTVTTYYLSSPEGPNHDEIDFEFLGNLTGEPYTLHTNIYCNGKGNREQQFYLWFDPTANFHNYSILWNPKRIIFYVDGTPIRLFENTERITGVPYPKRKPMRIYSSLWNADDWATQGGKVGTDWSLAPFVAEYRGFEAKGCVWLEELNVSGCDDQFRYLQVRKNNSRRRRDDDRKWLKQGGLDVKGRERMNWVQHKYMTYDYCKDVYRFPEGLPRECLQGDRRRPKKKSP